MFNTSNYSQQSVGLPVQNPFQLEVLQWADRATFLRETTKIGTVVGLVTSAASIIFSSDPIYPLAFTTACGISWLLTKTCAAKLEPEAQDTLLFFKDLKDGTNNSSYAGIKTFQSTGKTFS